MAENLPPFAAEWLQAEQMMGGRMVMPAEPVEQSRERFRAIFAGIIPFLPPPTEAVTVENVGYAGARTIRIYQPAGAAESMPVGQYIHSGGWYTGDTEEEDFLCRAIAEKSRMIIFSPEYRLPPENPYPAGLMIKFIMGGSAGGKLAACVSLKYAGDPTLRPAGVVLACMTSCNPQSLPSEYKSRYDPELYAAAPMIGNDILRQAREWYKAPPTDPLYSPLLHPNIKLLPPLYIAACTKDPTQEETLFFYEECKKQGVAADLVNG